MRIILALTLGVTAIAGAAYAQHPAITDWSTAPHPAGSVVGPREDDPAYLRFERDLQRDLDARKRALAATGTLSDISDVTTMPPPNDWKGTVDSWRLHMASCSARFKTYDAETDTFIAQPGVTRRCNL